MIMPHLNRADTRDGLKLEPDHGTRNISTRHMDGSTISRGSIVTDLVRCRRHLLFYLLVSGLMVTTEALHHMKRGAISWVSERDSDRPLSILNKCPETIWPAIGTQAGTGPSTQGFALEVGAIMNLTVSSGWQGRVWGRTNCSFNAAGTGASNSGLTGGGTACYTGDCGGILNCRGTGNTPVTLAEFTLASSSGQAFYDISLVDGYNLPLGIVSLYPESGNSSLTDIPPNLTNPVCIGTAALLAQQGSTEDLTLGTNASFPLPLDQSQSNDDVQRWCPWDLQLSPPQKPGDGVYPYPDDNIQRPEFDPCYSACSKWDDPQDCCTGAYDTPQTCSPSYYSRQAKSVCPDAYSYAFDDQTSTFIVPSGGGFQVVFCPPGRSTNILATLGPELRQLAQTGHVTPGQLADLENATFIALLGSAARVTPLWKGSGLWAVVMLVLAWLYVIV